MIDGPGIMHRSVMGVVAGRSIGEFGHLQRSQPDRAGILQPLQGGRSGGGDEIAPDFRAAGDHLAGVVIHVLVRQRHQGRLSVHCAAFLLAVLAACWTTINVAGSRSNGSVPATAANPSNAGPIELAIRSATSLLTGTPAISALALISFAVGLVMPRPLPLPARGCGPSPVLPYSTPPHDPFYRWR